MCKSRLVFRGTKQSLNTRSLPSHTGSSESDTASPSASPAPPTLRHTVATPPAAAVLTPDGVAFARKSSDRATVLCGGGRVVACPTPPDPVL